MIAIGIALLAVPFVFFGYAYIAYPALLWLVSRSRHESVPIPDPAEWPMVTITVPALTKRSGFAPPLRVCCKSTTRLSAGRS